MREKKKLLLLQEYLVADSLRRDQVAEGCVPCCNTGHESWSNNILSLSDWSQYGWELICLLVPPARASIEGTLQYHANQQDLVWEIAVPKSLTLEAVCDRTVARQHHFKVLE
jgi:hypothetical protein